MSMSSYMFDLEDQFLDLVALAVRDSENISEALEVALAHSDMVPDYTNSEIDEVVCDYWNDLWSKYAQSRSKTLGTGWC